MSLKFSLNLLKYISEFLIIKFRGKALTHWAAFQVYLFLNMSTQYSIY